MARPKHWHGWNVPSAAHTCALRRPFAHEHSTLTPGTHLLPLEHPATPNMTMPRPTTTTTKPSRPGTERNAPVTEKGLFMYAMLGLMPLTEKAELWRRAADSILL
jgi:hypothetical protein